MDAEPLLSSVGECEHPEDVAIQEEIDALKEEVFGEYYPVMLQEHCQPRLNELCPACLQKTVNWIHCNDCFASCPVCNECTIKMHHCLPFHRLGKWDVESDCWVSVSLYELGLCVPIRHEAGEQCSNPGTPIHMHVMHINGLHDLALQRCCCTVSSGTARALTRRQCIANGLYPATRDSPQQAYTFQCLDLFHKSNLKAFINIKQFCDLMKELTPNGPMQVR